MTYKPLNLLTKAPELTFRLVLNKIISPEVLLLLVAILLAGCGSKLSLIEYSGESLEVSRGIQSLALHPDGKRLAVGYFMHDEVEVWDIETKRPIFRIPSRRRPITESGDEIVFTPDGKYIVVQDFFDTKNGNPPFPRRLDHPDEEIYQNDVTRYRLATVWNLETKEKVSDLMGPGSGLHGHGQGGMCWSGGENGVLAMHRSAVVVEYEIPSGKAVKTINLEYPYPSHPSLRVGYRKMICQRRSIGYALYGFEKRKWQLAPSAKKDFVTPVVYFDSGNRLIYAGYTETVVGGLFFLPWVNNLVTYGNGPMQIWSTKGQLHPFPEFYETQVGSGGVVALPDGRHVVESGRQLVVWDLKQGKEVQTVPSPSDVFRMRVDAVRSRLAAASGKTVYFYKINSPANSLSGDEGRE